MIDLGTANGWEETPEIVKACTHDTEEKTISNCLHVITCKVCGYTYMVDSGD